MMERNGEFYIPFHRANTQPPPELRGCRCIPGSHLRVQVSEASQRKDFLYGRAIWPARVPHWSPQ